jgi:hypothetical protein
MMRLLELLNGEPFVNLKPDRRACMSTPHILENLRNLVNDPAKGIRLAADLHRTGGDSPYVNHSPFHRNLIVIVDTLQFEQFGVLVTRLDDQKGFRAWRAPVDEALRLLVCLATERRT